MLTLTWLCLFNSLNWLLRVVISFLKFCIVLFWSLEILTVLTPVAKGLPFSISMILFLNISFSANLSLNKDSSLMKSVDSPWISLRIAIGYSSYLIVLTSVLINPWTSPNNPVITVIWLPNWGWSLPISINPDTSLLSWLYFSINWLLRSLYFLNP